MLYKTFLCQSSKWLFSIFEWCYQILTSYKCFTYWILPLLYLRRKFPVRNSMHFPSATLNKFSKIWMGWSKFEIHTEIDTWGSWLHCTYAKLSFSSVFEEGFLFLWRYLKPPSQSFPSATARNSLKSTILSKKINKLFFIIVF